MRDQVTTLVVEQAMNNRFLTTLVVVALLSILPRSVASDRWETLKAINLVENPTNQTRMGSRGELGPYQFRSSTWRMHTQKPFNMAIDRATADEVAISHYEWIKRGLDNAGVDPNTHNIAMAWNCGLSAVIAGHVPAESYRYAEQVSNLVESFEQRAQAQAQAKAAEAQVVVVSTHDPAPSQAQSEFQVQFAPETIEPHFVLLTDADAPRLIVAGQRPRYVVAPATLRFALASSD
jgi:hypothetical protein